MKMKNHHTEKNQNQEGIEISDLTSLRHCQSISFFKIEKKEQDEPEQIPSLIFNFNLPKSPDELKSELLIESKDQGSFNKTQSPHVQKHFEIQRGSSSGIIQNSILMDFHNDPKEKEIGEKHRRTTMKSEFMKSLILSDATFLQKFVFLSKSVFLSHFLALILTVLKIILQEKINRYCWMREICECNDNFIVKLYSNIIDFFSCWMFYLIINSKTVFVMKEFRSKKLLKIFYFIYLILCIMGYSQFVDEKNYNSLDIYIIVIFAPFLFLFVYLYLLKFSFKLWIKNLCKANALNAFVFLNYLLVRYLFPSLKEFLFLKMSEFWLKNLMQLINACYFNVVFNVMKKLLFLYYQFAIQENNNYNSGISLMRFALGFCFSLNFSSLLKMEYNDIGGWVLICLYMHFVIKTYVDFDFLEKIKEIFVKKGKFIEKDSCEIYFKKLYSGCLLDFQIIAISRILFWYFLKKWCGLSFILKFVLDCQFNISEEFSISFFGFLNVILINIGLMIFIMGYMIKTRKILLEYKSRNHFLYNTYFIFLLHSFYEGCIQVISSVI